MVTFTNLSSHGYMGDFFIYFHRLLVRKKKCDKIAFNKSQSLWKVLMFICLGWHFVPRNVQHQSRPLPANKYSKPSQEWDNSALLGNKISYSWFQLKNNLFFQKIMGMLKKCKGAECNNVWAHVLFIQKF